MRLVMLTSGSRGDVQPFIALGAGLKRSGHEVWIACSETFAPMVRSYDLNCFPIQGDIASFLDRDEIRNQMNATDPLRVILSFRKMSRAFRAEFDELQHNAWAACQRADAILYHPGMINGYYFSQELNVPGILASPIPFSTTSTFPSILFYAGPRLGGLYNRITHSVFHTMFWRSLRPSVAAFWKQQGTFTRGSIQNPLKRIHQDHLPVLYSFSRHVITPPDDWGDHIAVTGYWFPPQEPKWHPPARIVDFLDSGPAPVYVGFGSIRGNHTGAGKTVEKVVHALRAVGQRIVVASDALDEKWKRDTDILRIKQAPHT